MMMAERSGLPVSVCAGSASPQRDQVRDRSIDARSTEAVPERLIGDKAYDSDPLDGECAKLGVTLIAPHRANRTKPKTQDGRVLRRYKRRWKVERLFAWLQNYRRIVTRYERHFENFVAFLKFATFMILAKKYL